MRSLDSNGIANGREHHVEVSLAEKILKRIQANDPFFSLEFFPPRTEQGAANLIGRYDIYKMLSVNS